VTGDPLAEAAAAARRGRLVVFPTDTVYGVGTRPNDPGATGLLFEAKRRPRSLELPVLGSTTAAIRRLAVFDDRAERLSTVFWPGPLTLVLPRSVQSAGWDLGGDGGTIGVRVPSHPLALALLASTGPLAVTSANLSGSPSAETCEDVQRTFGDLVAVYLCEEKPLTGEPSTVVDLAHASPRLLRTGSIGAEAIARCMPELGALLDSPPSPAE
jgi:tRNA threonylcarbamoyl adenosine modification protein (Sua5/YciO/YrdC/YwlC family)